MTVPHVSTVVPIVEGTDLVGTVPARLAVEGQNQGRVRMLTLPYEPLRVAVEAIHPIRSSHAPGLEWLIEQMIEALPPGPAAGPE